MPFTYDRALIIKREWLSRIFDFGKVWEMRSRNTKIRGKIHLIESGSGLVVGECTLVDSIKVKPEMAAANKHCHHVDDLPLLEKWCYAWVIQDAKRYETPIPYDHPMGAVIWVSL